MTSQLTNLSVAAQSAVATTDIQEFLRRLIGGERLDRRDARSLFECLLHSASDSQIACALSAIALRGETAEELAGFAEGMRARMVRVSSDHSALIDTCGTGASRAKTFNVSTAAAFVVAAAGLPIAKHGARAATSACGSADVLSALGIPLDLTPEQNERCLRELGLCFLFAPAHHPAAARVAPIRRELGFRSIFNLIGPLSNPASPAFQVLGVSDSRLLPLVAGALAELGCKRAWVVHGRDGLDEVSIAGATDVVEVKDGKLHSLELSPRDFGVSESHSPTTRVGSAQESAEVVLSVLCGKAGDANRDLVVVNAAAALHVGLGMPIKDSADHARHALASGDALRKFHALREFSTSAKREQQ